MFDDIYTAKIFETGAQVKLKENLKGKIEHVPACTFINTTNNK